MSRWVPGAALRLSLFVSLLPSFLLSTSACVFVPDLSRFPPCDDQGGCPAGSSCLGPERICLPDCGARGPCLPEVPAGDDGGTPPPAQQGDAGVDPLLLEEETLGDGVEGVDYAFQFRARGGTPPYTFSTRGELPPGLRLDGGILSGKPTTTGEFQFTLGLVDREARSTERAFSVRIHAPLILAGPGVLADFPKGETYTEQLSALGGRSPYRFELVQPNSLPAGLVLSANGYVQGKSSATGNSFDVRVTDDARPPQTVTLLLQLTASSCSLTCIRTRSVPAGKVGVSYDYSMQITSPYSGNWKVEPGGVLPPGIALDSSTGRLSGTPTATAKGNSYDFTLSRTDLFDTVKSPPLRLQVH
ncbi:putative HEMAGGLUTININ-RELATED PROTEIN [Cystobacter fuscus DSM 2262]|uniref:HEMAGGLUTININ-RELATED PROTEIN n=1 Tax=Cystobacter fuscus (strain ATCC 25194 / DSM 2262 / NBRC 100088 / M29) TaxID=1242864 RepID=S9QN79_CYSF2|nr:Ig domain-containing protein [Cystobacter fuscus]EPX58003.1 putative HEMAGGLUTININ-RELATED PROTEIN [Cystobacter fuscus DSM 2262]